MVINYKPLFFDNGLFYGVMLYPFMSAADEVSQPQCGDGQSRPGKCEIRADLTENVKGQMGIIPHLHTQKKIENDTERKLHRRDDDTARKTTEKKTFYSAAYNAYEHYRDTACKKH